MTHRLRAGAAACDITPATSQFLYGYPHVPRWHTGVHDPLLSSAIFLDDGSTPLLFIANDVIFVSKALCARARERISAATGIPPAQIMISATHTHSGPVTVAYISNEADSVVPKPDPAYLEVLEEGIVRAGIAAAGKAEAAEIALCRAQGAGLGTNRREVSGPADPEIPLLLIRSAQSCQPLACMLVCAMHPTVLHEDSTVISGDFPGLARKQLLEQWLGPEGVVVYHMGAAGNQSPRHVTRANTLEETARLAGLLAKSVLEAAAGADYQPMVPLAAHGQCVELIPSAFPAICDAERRVEDAVERLRQLRASGASRQVIRTAECDWFGAEETLTLSRAAAEGRVEAARRSVMPAEILIFQVGDFNYVGWPGEVFVEYALELRARVPGTYLITLANGEVQGYIVTPEAAAEGGYEASNAIFAAESGAVLLGATLQGLARGKDTAT